MYKSNWNNLIQGVEMGRFRGGNGIQGVETGRFRAYVKWEELDLEFVELVHHCNTSVLTW